MGQYAYSRSDTALKHISTAAGGISPSLSTTKEEIFRKVSGGCVTYGSKDKSYSTWLLERWVEKGQSPRHPYGAKTFIYNDEMPEDAKFVGLTNSILHTDGSGFLCPTSSSQKAWFTLHTPPGKPPKTGPLKTDDIVELRVRDSGDSTDLGVLMNSKYHEGPGEIQNLINNVPAFAPRNAAAKDPGMQIDRGLDDVPGRFLQFKIVVHEWF